MLGKAFGVLAALAAALALATPTAALTTVSSTARSEAYFAVSSDGSAIAYQSGPHGRGSLYVWSHGSTKRITRSLTDFSLSANGNVIAFTAGAPEATFVDLASGRRSAIPGFVLAHYAPHITPLLDATGRHVLLDKLAPPGKPPSMTTGVLYDRARRSFVVLPHRPGTRTDPFALSSDGTIALYGETRPYKGEVAVVLYNRVTRTVRRVKKWRSVQIAWLSSDGMTALLELSSNQPIIYDYRSGKVALPLGREVKPEVWELGPWSQNAPFVNDTLTGDGKRIFFTCGLNAYFYDISSSQFYLVAANPLGNVASADVFMAADGTEDGSKVVMATATYSGAIGKPGLVELDTAAATLVGPKITPVGCEPIVRE
jgi:hypothetical protein